MKIALLTDFNQWERLHGSDALLVSEILVTCDQLHQWEGGLTVATQQKVHKQLRRQNKIMYTNMTDTTMSKLSINDDFLKENRNKLTKTFWSQLSHLY